MNCIVGRSRSWSRLHRSIQEGESESSDLSARAGRNVDQL